MSKTLELPDPLFDRLQAAARAQGKTPQEWIAVHLAPTSPPGEIDAPKTLAELMRGRVGLFHSGGGTTLSENCGEHVADELERQRREKP